MFFSYFFLIAGVLLGQKSDQQISHKYHLVTDWTQLPSGDTFGPPSGLGLDSDQNLIVFHRAGVKTNPVPKTPINKNTIIKLHSKTGKILDSWGANMFYVPHGLTVDHENNIWVTDVGGHQVFKFSSTGKLLMKLGVEKEPGDDQLHFNKPTDVAVNEDGSFYVSDGYGNSRVIKFSATGEYLFEWGKKGSEEGEFNLPHAIDIDKNGDVIVADRENSRIQKFDAKGNFLKEWKNKSEATVYAVKSTDNSLLAVDYLVKTDNDILGSNVLIFNPRLQLDTKFGRIGSYKGPVCRYHDIEIDSDHNIYVADLLNNLVQKFQLAKK